MRNGSPTKRRPVLRAVATIASAMTVVLTLVASIAYARLEQLQGTLTVDNSLEGVLSSPSPGGSQELDASPLNILLVGSDTRTGQGAGFGDAAKTSSGNGQSDTVLLLHIARGRKSAFAVSIPRDSWVTRPSCKSDGSLDGNTKTGKFNAAYAQGGRACVIHAVESLTKVKINSFVEVDFNGFKRIVDALGGVEVCTVTPLNDPIVKDANGNFHGSGLKLPAGTSRLDGNSAIQFVRARYLDPTADIGRMNRQQYFLSSVIRSASEANLLTNPVKLNEVLSAVADSLTVDSSLAGDNLIRFLLSVRDLRPSNVSFFTVPTVARGDNVNLVWVQAKADLMWKAMANDSAYPPRAKAAVASQPTLTVPPTAIRVEVRNGTDTPGLGQRAADQLRALGYQVSSVSNATLPRGSASTLTFDPGWDESVKTLAWGTRIERPTAKSGQGRTMVLTIGYDWTAPRAAVVSKNVEKPKVASNSACLDVSK